MLARLCPRHIAIQFPAQASSIAQTCGENILGTPEMVQFVNATTKWYNLQLGNPECELGCKEQHQPKVDLT